MQDLQFAKTYTVTLSAEEGVGWVGGRGVGVLFRDINFGFFAMLIISAQLFFNFVNRPHKTRSENRNFTSAKMIRHCEIKGSLHFRNNLGSRDSLDPSE